MIWKSGPTRRSTALADAKRGAIKQHMGIWRDLKVKRRKTEVDMLVG